MEIAELIHQPQPDTSQDTPETGMKNKQTDGDERVMDSAVGDRQTEREREREREREGERKERERKKERQRREEKNE